MERRIENGTIDCSSIRDAMKQKYINLIDVGLKHFNRIYNSRTECTITNDNEQHSLLEYIEYLRKSKELLETDDIEGLSSLQIECKIKS